MTQYLRRETTTPLNRRWRITLSGVSKLPDRCEEDMLPILYLSTKAASVMVSAREKR